MARSHDFKLQLAAIEHERWADWQRWLHSQCVKNEDGSLTIPAPLVERWERQIATDFWALSGPEQQSDLDQVDRYWPLLEKFVHATLTLVFEKARTLVEGE